MRGYPEVTVGVVVFNKKGEILLLKSHKWHGRHIIPCGHIELGESMLDAARREVKEETNLDIEDIEFLQPNELINSPEFHDKERHFVCLNFCARAKDGEILLDDEAQEYVWVRPQEALGMEMDSLTRASVEKFLKRQQAL